MTEIRAGLPLSSPMTWLSRGWNDMLCTGMRGTYYGAFFAIMGYAISIVYDNLWQATMGVTAGFFLMGPFICTGIYELSRQRDNGHPYSLIASWTAWFRNWKSIAFFACLS